MATTGLERGLYQNYIANNTKRRDPFPFELTVEQFAEIIKQDCYICGRPPEQVYWKTRKAGTLFYNGVDRLDNTKGYVIDNVRACCKKCNSVKSDMGLLDLKKHLVKMLRGLGAL